MAKFDYGKSAPDKNCVAYICQFNGDPERQVLVLKNTDNHGKHTYIYEDGDILTQNVDCEDESIKKFYKGDSVTITF